MRKMLKNVICYSLCLIMLTSSLYGCSKVDSSAIPVSSNAPVSVDTAELAAVITEEVRKEAEEYQEAQEKEEAQEEVFAEVSDNWEDYVGDIDTLVYGLLSAEYERDFYVFEAVVDLDEDTQIYGLAYTNYEYYIEVEDGDSEIGYFPAGFIGFIGEEGIDESLVEDGIDILPLSFTDDCRFIYAYETDPYMEHCVAWGEYIKYGVDDKGTITYEAEEYKTGEFDRDLGTLYSFDEKKTIYEDDFGEYQYITGESLYTEIDYDALEAEVNRILDEQDYNFANVDVNTCIQESREAYELYLMSLQEETFMGYKVSELIEISSQLDTSEIIQFSDDGMMIINVTDLPGNSPTDFVKWSTGIVCGLSVAGCIALDIVAPELTIINSAVMGATIEVFMQVVVENHSLEDINWAKVGVAALSSSMMAWLTPLAAFGAAGKTVKILGQTLKLSETALKVAGAVSGEAMRALVNAVVSGATGAAYVAIDGGTEEEILDAFKAGALLGGLLTAGVSALGAGVSAVGKIVKTKALESVKPNSWIDKVLKGTGKWIENNKIKKIVDSTGKWVEEQRKNIFSDELEDILVPKSVHQATEEALYQLRVSQAGGDEVLAQKLMQLPSENSKNFVLTDGKGNRITKADLAKNGGKGVYVLSDDCDPKIAEAFKKRGITEINVNNGDPDLSVCSVFDFEPKEIITSNRELNMRNYRKQLANEWSEHPSEIPSEIKAELDRLKYDPSDLSAKKLEMVFSNLNLTLHEGTDGMVYIADGLIHRSVGHYGGVALAKVLEKYTIGVRYMPELLATQVQSVQGTLIGEYVDD